MKKLLLLVCTIFVGATSAHAETAKLETYSFDKLYTQILFAVDHMGFTKSHGTFTDFDGKVILDRNQIEKSTVDVVVKTGSVDLNDKTWNEHVGSDNLLKVALFPEATFKSTSIVQQSEKTAKMTGDLTLLGVTKPVTLDVTFNKEGFIKYTGKNAIGFTATGMLKRSDWGMNFGLPDVGDEVYLTIEASLERDEKKDVNP